MIQSDYCSQSNAEKLARIIERYWREAMPGCVIHCWTESVKSSAGVQYTNIVAVRSTMINGRPQPTSIQRTAA